MSPPPEPRSDKSRQSEHPQITTMTKAPPSIRRRGFPLPAHPHRQRLPRPQRKRRVTPTRGEATTPSFEPAPGTFPEQAVSEAVNRAADDILDAIDAPDTGLRDA